jgi:hypothetical protein
VSVPHPPAAAIIALNGGSSTASVMLSTCTLP